MALEVFPIEAATLFSESLIWQLNRDYYHQVGLEAWRSGAVPHYMTSNSMVGKTYAELILAMLKDLADQGQTEETVQIIELGAGHARLTFHILQHLEKLMSFVSKKMPSYRFILSDIVEEDLLFFEQHPQLQKFYESGLLDCAYFDAINGKEIYLRKSKKTITPQSLNQPLIAIGNYFFDSLPNDLFLIREKEMHICSMSLESKVDPSEVDSAQLIKNLEPKFHSTAVGKSMYQEPVLNEILDQYNNAGLNTFLFFPHNSIRCISNLENISTKGLMLLSMDKGFHQLNELNNRQKPELITHGSFSIWVNYHALGSYCEKQGGTSLFPSNSTFDLEVACLLFLQKADSYSNVKSAYERRVNDFGPDDFNAIKKFAYANIEKLTLIEHLAFLRLSAYDSTLFMRLLPHLKKVTTTISMEGRKRLAEALHKVWHFYFNIGEPIDLAYTIGGLYHDLGFHAEAVDYYQKSEDYYGPKIDTYCNRILCYYQLREDFLFVKTLNQAQQLFPDSAQLQKLANLDLDAV